MKNIKLYYLFMATFVVVVLISTFHSIENTRNLHVEDIYAMPEPFASTPLVSYQE